MLKILNGTWQLERHVAEFKISMVGTAKFTKKDAITLNYEENGNYYHQHNKYDFFQKYKFLMHENKLLIIKYDNSILHTFELEDFKSYPIRLNHDHKCGLDTYSCEFILQNNKWFQTFYAVKGHNKNYTITTNFNKITESN